MQLPAQDKGDQKLWVTFKGEKLPGFFPIHCGKDSAFLPAHF